MKYSRAKDVGDGTNFHANVLKFDSNDTEHPADIDKAVADALKLVADKLKLNADAAKDYTDGWIVLVAEIKVVGDVGRVAAD
jgi:hypothetical protein